tara:strand:+ start:494 stop:874 length:381 start_codon:yes stop_codon:yes gene_type:complete
MKNKTNSNRTFGILFAIVFFIIALWPLTNNEGVRLWSVIVALIFLFIGLFKPNILDPLNTIWIKLGELLGRIIAPIIMGIIYFFVVTPIGLFLKIIKKDLLRMKNSSTNTYWIRRDKKFGSMKRQF